MLSLLTEYLQLAVFVHCTVTLLFLWMAITAAEDIVTAMSVLSMAKAPALTLL